MHLSELNRDYMFAMCQSMYRYEVSLRHITALLSDPEIMDFYSSYLGGIPCQTRS